MADALGIKGKLGIKAVATWDAAYAAVDTAIPFVDESLSQNFTRIQRQALMGYGGRESSDQGMQSVQGTVNFELDYNNFIPILKAAMGAEAAGVIDITDTITDNFLWLEFEKQVSRFRAGASRISKFTISGDAGSAEPIKLSCDFISRDCDRSATAFPTITPQTPDRVIFRHLTQFRMGDQVDVLVAGDQFPLQSFELVFDRNLKPDDYVSATGGAIQFPIEPVENDFRTATLKLKFPRYSADTIPAWKDADTPLQCVFLFSGPSAQSFKIQIPNLRFLEGFNAPVEGPGPMALEGTFELSRSLPGHVMYVGNEFKITIV